MTSCIELLRSTQDPTDDIGNLISLAFRDGLTENKFCEKKSCQHREGMKVRRRLHDGSLVIWVMTGKGNVRTLMASFECVQCKSRRRIALASVKL